jgi:hypothetical protein
MKNKFRHCLLSIFIMLISISANNILCNEIQNHNDFGKLIKEKRLDGKIYQSTNHGKTWECFNLRNNMDFQKIVERRLNGKYFISFDKGQHWVEMTKKEIENNSYKLNLSNNILVYPNPFLDNITISLFNHKDQNLNIRIYDSMGNVVVNSLLINITSSSYDLNLSFKNLLNGIYYLRIFDLNFGESEMIYPLIKL